MAGSCDNTHSCWVITFYLLLYSSKLPTATTSFLLYLNIFHLIYKLTSGYALASLYIGLIIELYWFQSLWVKIFLISLYLLPYVYQFLRLLLVSHLIYIYHRYSQSSALEARRRSKRLAVLYLQAGGIWAYVWRRRRLPPRRHACFPAFAFTAAACRPCAAP